MPLMPRIVVCTVGGLQGHSGGRRHCCVHPESMQHPGCLINSLLNCVFVKILKAKDNSQNNKLSKDSIQEGNLYSRIVSDTEVQLLPGLFFPQLFSWLIHAHLPGLSPNITSCHKSSSLVNLSHHPVHFLHSSYHSLQLWWFSIGWLSLPSELAPALFTWESAALNSCILKGAYPGRGWCN